jgi:hypothetical protein
VVIAGSPFGNNGAENPAGTAGLYANGLTAHPFENSQLLRAPIKLKETLVSKV